ncbi:MAG: LPS export ABC transporter permease LptG [Roseateles asaccharophilus]|uniref:Lipopolysaccharide export system permease protein n=1 Tax=Roseateles asaccharophilus TaxID=582607 RepID=A0A4R6N9Z3_9BURK|nr:LPS export ABC transporter permease LptG [Roseateles asaccharophilus]MDN3543512.1 LPS export ABC transporter permease LptG [Roseateles asaccharophilus]TDP12110.1 lipopolysaccharide export system permease protein [Roseateles asaccharophilus]
MKTVRRLLYRELLSAVFFVALAFLSLFYFIDFVDHLDDLGRKGLGAGKAAWLALLEQPGHFYELFPIAVLIGSIYSLARLAQSSEFTILRTGGLGPQRALSLLTALALGFAALTFIVGDYIAPGFERYGEQEHARLTGSLSRGASGAWLKDKQTIQGQERSFSVHVGRALAPGRLEQVRIFEFDAQGALLSRLEAAGAEVQADGLWKLREVVRTQWNTQAPVPRIQDDKLPTLDWASGLDIAVIGAALLPAKTMSTLDLYRYTRHLSAQEQSAQQHNIQFWRKAFYPFACLVMVALALPFAYLHGRAGGISLKVFGGIMLGISFVLLNNLAGHLGMLRGWTPWAVAATPSLIYMGISLAAFGWLVRYR